MYISRTLWMWVLFFGLGANAAQAQMKIKWKGELGSNLFIGLHPQDDFVKTNNLGTLFNYRNSNLAAFEVLAKLGDQIKGQARIELRNLNFSKASNSLELEDYNNPFPVSIRLMEAFIEFYGLLGFLDLAFGQQRIAWGSTTVFNPTDNLNPFNLENPVDFEARLPVPAIRATMTFGEHVTVTLVNIPMYTPPVLPITLFREVTNIDTSAIIPDWLKIGQISSNEVLKLPEFNVENMQWAARVAVSVDPVNFAVSYFYGRSFIPVPQKVPITALKLPGISDIADCKLNPSNPISDKCSVDATAKDVELIFPRFHSIGADLSASLFGIDFRVEAALFIPVQKVDTLITVPDEVKPGLTLIGIKEPLTSEAYKAQPYVKLVAEMEYTFPGGYHFILQYIYGFFNEQNFDQLHHYWMLTSRKDFFRGKFEVRLVGGFELDTSPTSGEKQDGSSPGYAFLANLELIFKPFDAGQITLGGIVSRGVTGTTFRLFQPLAQAYLRVKMTFK